MNFLKPALAALIVAISLPPSGVRAQEQPPVEKTAPEQPPPAEKPKAELPLKPVPPPNRKPIKRRSVQQIIEPTMPIVTEGYRPTLVIRPPSAPLTPTQPQAPVRLNCDAGGCTDTSGARYNNGVGNTLSGPQGQLCTRGVVGAQCF